MWVSNLLNCEVDKHKGTELLSFHVIATLSFQTIIRTSIRFVMPVINIHYCFQECKGRLMVH